MKSLLKTPLSDKAIAFNGARIAIAGVFVYSFLIMIYTIARSSVTIGNIIQGKERDAILYANGVSIAYSVAVFSLLMALISLVSGVLTSLFLKHLLMYFNAAGNFKKALLITCITAVLVLMMIYLTLYWRLEKWMTFQYFETLLFWFLFPAIIFLTATLLGGIQLNRELGNSDDHESK